MGDGGIVLTCLLWAFLWRLVELACVEIECGPDQSMDSHESTRSMLTEERWSPE